MSPLGFVSSQLMQFDAIQRHTKVGLGAKTHPLGIFCNFLAKKENFNATRNTFRAFRKQFEQT